MFVAGLAEVIDQREALGRLVGGLDPDAVPLGEAPDLWAAFDAIERLAAAGKTLLADRVDESQVWQREGHRRAADYLAKRSGSSVGAARAGLETSKRLRSLPETQQALRRGELSRSQAEAVADAAAANPGAERSLLEAAGRLSLAELRERCGRAKAAGDKDRDATHRRLRRERRLHRYTDSQGAWNLVARGTPDDGALLNTVLDPIIDDVFQAARRAGERQPLEAYAFDALIEMARRARQVHEPGRASGGEPSEAPPAPGPGRDPADPAATGATGATGDDHAGRPTAPPGSPPATPAARRHPARTDPTHLALIRVDLEALVRGATEGDELCEISGVGPIPVGVARRLLGDSVLKLVVTKGVGVANVTHLGRGPTAAQRIALLWRSPACAAEGCPNRYTEIDHRVPWAQTHHTRLDELDPLCKPCHWLKTHEGWALTPGTGSRPLVPPGDPRHPRSRDHAA